MKLLPDEGSAGVRNTGILPSTVDDRILHDLVCIYIYRNMCVR